MTKRERAVLAGGCFWGMQDLIRKLPGIQTTRVGYTGGDVPNATYRNHGTHAEAIEIWFDPDVISYADLLDIFFATHNPTTLNRQGNDVGTQYRSAIFPHSPQQEAEAKAAIGRAQPDHADAIVTTIEPDGPWYPAEDYHQQYWDRVGDRNPYCMAVIPPKLAKLRKGFAEKMDA